MSSKSKVPHLIVHKGNHTGRVYELDKKIITIGRDSVNDVVVNDNLISRNHARLITTEGNHYMLEDLNSTNGTFINGKKLIGAAPITFGDEIQFGQEVYAMIKDSLFRSPAPAPEPPSETERVKLPVKRDTAPIDESYQYGPLTRRVDNEAFAGVTLEQLSPSDTDDNAVVFSGPTPLDGVAVDDGRVSERDSTEARHPHLFLSYSTLDHGIMHNVTKTLNAAGLQVWVDKQYLTPGDPSWRRAIQDAIERSRCVVVILSPDAKQSKWVEAELDYAESQHKKIFCILARGDRTSSALLGYTLAQWVDIQRGYDAEMNKLIDVLWKYLHDTK